jgi:hypothetical protein
MGQNRLSGINPEAYMGVEASSPPQFVYFKRDPTTQDYYNFNIGTIWLNTITVPERIWILVNMAQHVATWVQLLTGAGGAVQFQTADGLQAVPDVTGTLFVPGGTLITTATAPNANSVEISVTNGGDGQIIIGQGANPPVWGDLTSVGGTVTITPDHTGPAINLEVVGAPGATDYRGNDWPPNFATPAADILNIVGDGVNINTTGAGNTVTINLIQPGAGIAYHADNGVDAHPLGNVLNIVGDGVNTVTVGVGNSIGISLLAPIVPFRSAFSYRCSITPASQTGDGTVAVVLCPTIIFDLNGDFNGATSTFTAPRTGTYFFRGQVEMQIQGGGGPNQYLQTYMVSTTTTYVSNNVNWTNIHMGGQFDAAHDVIMQLTAGNTVQFKYSVSGGAVKNISYQPGANGHNTTFSGFLIS